MTVYYGENDYLTYAPRKRNGTEKKSSVLDNNRFWPHATQAVPAKKGSTMFTIKSLKSKTQYFYRILIENDQGKIWSFSTKTFSTR